MGKDNLLWCSVNKKRETFQRVTPALVTLQLDYYNTFHIGLPLNISRSFNWTMAILAPFSWGHWIKGKVFLVKWREGSLTSLHLLKIDPAYSTYSTFLGGKLKPTVVHFLPFHLTVRSHQPWTHHGGIHAPQYLCIPWDGRHEDKKWGCSWDIILTNTSGISFLVLTWMGNCSPKVVALFPCFLSDWEVAGSFLCQFHTLWATWLGMFLLGLEQASLLWEPLSRDQCT